MKDVPRTTPATGKILDTGKVKVWYHDEGKGEPLILLGGFTAGHFAFDFVRPYLGGYRLVTWEPRGLGPSECTDPASHPYSVSVWAEDLFDFLGALGIARTHIWAGGFGSYYALLFAARHPGLVGGLATYTDVYAADESKGYPKIWNVYRAIVESFGTKGFGARVLANIFDVSGLPWFPAWEAQNIEDVLHEETVEATVGYCCTAADIRDELDRIQAPVLAIQGDQGWDGEPLPPEADRSLTLMRERIPRLETVTIPGAHAAYVLVQQPKACARAVREFLGRHPLTSP